ncbi:hypothetical protein AcW1_009293 [Taiwanofungus camphoratus]|nr:hypothetical protein AcV5_003370 [Antrodia cinnamomea]KAI0947570.1 hypothetical protein AcW1_009293 [Antrodia cinnamomea]
MSLNFRRLPERSIPSFSSCVNKDWHRACRVEHDYSGNVEPRHAWRDNLQNISVFGSRSDESGHQYTESQFPSFCRLRAMPMVFSPRTDEYIGLKDLEIAEVNHSRLK